MNKFKNNKLLIICLVITIIILSSCNFNVIKGLSDDNYSTYLYNQNINVDNDKAHLLSEQSDGSNSYRNIFQSDFLFPSKLQDDMISTFSTSEFSKYSFNQFYFHNLNNKYNYQSYDDSNNIEQEIILDDYEIEKGNLLIDGNTSIYGNYNGSYSFENEIGLFGKNISLISNSNNENNQEVISNFQNHNSVLKIIDDSGYTQTNYYFENILENGIFETWIAKNYNYGQMRLYFSYVLNHFHLKFYNNELQLENGSKISDFNNNIWYHLKIQWYLDSTYDIYWNNIKECSKIDMNIPMSIGINNMMFVSYTNNINKPLYYDAFSIVNFNDYNENDNLYPDSDIFDINRSEIITNNGSLNKYPNSDIDVINKWYNHPTGSGLVYPNLVSDNNDYAYTDAHAYNPAIAEFGVQDINFECLIQNITMKTKSLIWYYTMKPENYIKIGTNLDNYETWYKCSNYGYNNIWVYDYFNLTFDDYITTSEFNNMEFKLSAYDDGALYFQVDLVEFQVDYFNYTLDNIEVSYENNINYIENYKPYQYNLYFNTIGFNSTYSNVSIYNYDLQEYYLIKEYLEMSYETYNFILNESSYFRFNKLKMKIESETITLSDLLIIDYLSLNISYILQNTDGFQELIVYNQRYDDSNNYKGYSRFEFLIYNDSIKYRYSEINVYTDDYIYAWIKVDTSNMEVDNIELQCHARYGLNTLDIEILNFYYIIYINYDYKIELFEQSRKELNVSKIKSSFNYTSVNMNFLNLTGVVGNYSYTSFKGCRSLYGLTNEMFHRYFTIPYFSQDIDVSIEIDLPDDIIINPDEPEPPTQYYWTYETFKTEYHQTSSINIGNWSVEFKLMKSVSYKAKHFYQPNYVSKSDLGSWRWKIKFTDAFSYTVSFNFMRNALKTVLNLVLLFFQFIFYLVVASLSYVLMFIGTSILVFIWNILVYHVFYALMFVLWYLYEGLYLLLDTIWLGLVWFYENYLIPFYVWFTEIAIPYLVEFIIIPAIAFTLTLVIWIITLGNVDFWTLYDTIHEQLLITSDIVIDIIMELVDNIVILIYFIALYVLLTLMCFLKHIICKARGYTNRSNSLYDSFEVYIYPIILFYNLCMKIKDLLAQWV